jgi:short-subunit dehydrogenase
MLPAVQTAVVTGAGRGLGKAIARRLAQRGLAVLVTDIDIEAARATATELGEQAWAEQLDVRDGVACRAVAAHAAKRGPLAVWVNNAGVILSGRSWEAPDDALDSLVGVNLLGVLHGSNAAVAVMRGTGGGRILNIASLSSLGPVPGLAVYGATKHAVLAYSLSLQGELRDAGLAIEVRSLCPDTIDTQLVRSVAGEEEAALMWSGARVLEVDEVADNAVELLYGRRLKRVIPTYRGLIMRSALFFPAVFFRLVPVFKRLGDHNRRRWRESAPPRPTAESAPPRAPAQTAPPRPTARA